MKLSFLSPSLEDKLLGSEVCFNAFCTEFVDMLQLSPYKVSLQWVVDNCCQIEKAECRVCLVPNTVLICRLLA